MKTSPLVLAALLGLTSAQQAGTVKASTYVPLGMKNCTKDNGCQWTDKSVTLDANWRWIHGINGYENCYDGTSWNSKFCPDDVSCAKNCDLEGVPDSDWKDPYGVKSDGLTMQLGYVTSGNVGSRTYMLNEKSGTEYEMFELLGKEFTFTVDVSTLPCGLNGALYFVDMDKTGDKGSGNEAGAPYGTGYCDAQCPNDIKFINGKGNVEGWDNKTGSGKNGSCCAEMDIWEGNKIASAFTAHPCTIDGQQKCSDPVTCGFDDHRYDGVCDKDGCDLNPFRAGVKDFYGEGSDFMIDTSKPFSVVTAFHTDSNGDLSEIRRKFVQEGRLIEHPASKVDTMSKQFDSITDEMCESTKDAFGDKNDFKAKGALKKMGDSMKGGMVLVMSIWDDAAAHMLWLDSTYPTDKTSWGGPRGTCPTDSGNPDDVRKQSPNSYVKYGDIRIGEIDSTYNDLIHQQEFLQ